LQPKNIKNFCQNEMNASLILLKNLIQQFSSSAGAGVFVVSAGGSVGAFVAAGAVIAAVVVVVVVAAGASALSVVVAAGAAAVVVDGGIKEPDVISLSRAVVSNPSCCLALGGSVEGIIAVTRDVTGLL
jgi:hypothetical protein